jgi:uncharacterized membrane protein YozB (DUF420 family)
MVSAGVLAEIAKAPPADRAAIRKQMHRMQITVCPPDPVVAALARAYIQAGILADRRQADAEHIAAATCFECDYLVSWNHRHMTRPSKKLQYEAVNRVKGYLRTPLICNPLEAYDDLRLR